MQLISTRKTFGCAHWCTFLEATEHCSNSANKFSRTLITLKVPKMVWVDSFTLIFPAPQVKTRCIVNWSWLGRVPIMSGIAELPKAQFGTCLQLWLRLFWQLKRFTAITAEHHICRIYSGIKQLCLLTQNLVAILYKGLCIFEEKFRRHFEQSQSKNIL